MQTYTITREWWGDVKGQYSVEIKAENRDEALAIFYEGDLVLENLEYDYPLDIDVVDSDVTIEEQI